MMERAMMAAEDLTGQRFGCWFVVERSDDRVTYPPKRGRKKVEIMWTCKCACAACEAEEPTVRDIPGIKLRAGRSQSCGRTMRTLPCAVEGCEELIYSKGYCATHEYRMRTYGDPSVFKYNKHGATGSRTYQTWSNMIARCTDPKNASWDRYGGASPPVVVCERWAESFLFFLQDMGERPSVGHQIHRIDNALVYGPETCQWLHKDEHRALHRALAHPNPESA